MTFGVGENTTIMSGIVVGDGAIIQNNSHVVKNVEPYSIVGGNPAKLIEMRFTTEQIRKLLEIKWWNWDFNRIQKVMNSSKNVEDFLKYLD